MSQANPSIIETMELTPEQKKFLVEKKYPVCAEYILTNPCRLLIPPRYKDLKEAIRQFEFRANDVVLMGYPKTGTTWMSEILWAMTSVDELHRAEEESIHNRIIYLHNDVHRPIEENDDTVTARMFRSKFPGQDINDDVWLSLAKVASDRRVIRCHFLPPLLHPSLLEKAKLVLILRNPKDTCVSYYNFAKAICAFSFHEFCDIFMSDVMPWGVYWNHVRQTWPLTGRPNVHYVFYEDLKRNLMEELEKLNQFFEFNLSEDQLKKVAEYVDVEQMRRREKKFPVTDRIEATFFKNAKAGNWNSVATPELDARMDKWIEEGSRGMDIKFSYQ